MKAGLKNKLLKSFTIMEIMVGILVVSVLLSAFTPVISKKISSTGRSVTATLGKLGSDAECGQLSLNGGTCGACLGGFCFNCNISCGDYQKINSLQCKCEDLAECAAGKYMDMTIYSCVECEAGYYCPGGKNSKQECPDGKYSIKLGATDESDCSSCSDKVKHCKSCNSSTGECNECVSGYELSDDKLKCSSKCPSDAVCVSSGGNVTVKYYTQGEKKSIKVTEAGKIKVNLISGGYGGNGGGGKVINKTFNTTEVWNISEALKGKYFQYSACGGAGASGCALNKTGTTNYNGKIGGNGAYIIKATTQMLTDIENLQVVVGLGATTCSSGGEASYLNSSSYHNASYTAGGGGGASGETAAIETGLIGLGGYSCEGRCSVIGSAGSDLNAGTAQTACNLNGKNCNGVNGNSGLQPASIDGVFDDTTCIGTTGAGKNGAVKVTYLDYDQGGKGGDKGNVLVQDINVSAGDVIQIYVGAGGSGGKATYMNSIGEIKTLTNGSEGEESYITINGTKYSATTASGNAGTGASSSTGGAGAISGIKNVTNSSVDACTAGTGGSAGNNGKDATGYGGCGGGGAGSLADGGKGSIGYAEITFVGDTEFQAVAIKQNIFDKIYLAFSNIIKNTKIKIAQIKEHIISLIDKKRNYSCKICSK